MDNTKVEEFKKKYKEFLKGEDVELRNNQIQLVPVLKDVIAETLQNTSLTNEHLTSLIEMLKARCTNKTFEKYLKVNIKSNIQRNQILDRFTEIGETGFTGRGLFTIKNLSRTQLRQIKKFLTDAFLVKNVDQAVKLTEDYDNLKIPEVTQGIYSTWLYYINPEIFPIFNNGTKKFRKWLGLPVKYPSFIKAANELKNLVKETDHGRLDWYAHLYENDKGDGPDKNVKEIQLNGRKLFKISHGSFITKGELKKAGILDVLMENDWIAMGNDTKNQFDWFGEEERIGDYVYICHGGKNLYAIGRITSEVKSLNEFFDGEFPIDEEWSYREIEVLQHATEESFTGLDNKKKYMPGGNSTFWEVPADEIDDMNEKLFLPHFGVKFISNNDGENFPMKTEITRNVILYGPPGTGKTYNSIFQAVAIIENKPSAEVEKEQFSVVKERYEEYREQGRIIFTTFHQSLGYEDFIEGIKPVTSQKEGGTIIYKVEDGIFKKLCTDAAFAIAQQAKKEKELKGIVDYDDKKKLISSMHPNEFAFDATLNYVIIIDEINRGNIANIFGELITLLEDDKRLGNDKALTVELPYSHECFGVPKNLYVVGTMNTADRSAEAIDTALRRRFSFIQKEPEADKLKITSDGIDLEALLIAVNTRLKVLKDSDHTIGHAWLLDVKDADLLRRAFATRILPLLREFFYNDYEKLGLVLGDSFFKVQIPVDEDVFADFSGSNSLASQYQSSILELKNPDELTIEDFKSLYK